MAAATSKIRYANPDLEKQHQQQVDEQKNQQVQPEADKPAQEPGQPRSAAPTVSGREFGNDHATQAENATTEAGLADDLPKA